MDFPAESAILSCFFAIHPVNLPAWGVLPIIQHNCTVSRPFPCRTPERWHNPRTCTWERSDRKPVPYEKVTTWNSAASNPLAATRPRLEVHERTCVRVPKHSGRSAGAALPLFAQSSEKGGRRLRTLTPKPLRFPQRRISGMRPQAWEPRPRVHF